MAIAGQYDFVPLGSGVGYFGSASATLSVGIFQWVYKADGHGLKKSKAVYRVKGPASKWQEINNRARFFCDLWNSARGDLDSLQYKQKKSEMI
jgi:hypothetical protein